MKKKPFAKSNKLYLGGKKQKGGTLFGLSLAVPLLAKLLTGKGRKKRKGKKRRGIRRRW